MIKLTGIVLILSFLSTSFFAKTYLYKRAEKGETFYQEVTIEEQENGLIMFVVITDSQTNKMICNENYETLSFEIDEPGTNTYAERIGNKIIVKKTINGKLKEKTMNIDEDPWIQMFLYPLMHFISSDKSEIDFFLMNPNDIMLFKFNAKKDKEETIELCGSKQKCIKLKLTIKGVPDAFYKNYYYYRKDDGLFVYHKSENNGKEILYEYIEEE